MTTKTLEKSKKTSIKELQREVALLRSFVIGHVGRDSEGEYRPEFVKRVLRAAQEKPKYEFKDAKSFLRHIQDK